MKLSRKYGLFFIALSVVLALILSLAQIHWVNTLVIDGVSARMRTNIRSGWVSLASRERALDIVATFVARDPALRRAAEDPERQQTLLDHALADWHLDYLGVVDQTGVVVARAGGTPSGKLGIPWLESSIRAGTPLAGFVRLDSPELEAQGIRLADRCPGASTDAGMLIVVARPVYGAEGRATGAVVAGILLNCAFSLVDEIQEQIFEEEILMGRRVGTATIFMGPTRIATTVLTDEGKRAIGTRVSEEVESQTLLRGEPWTGRAWVVNDWYITRYEPIRDPEGTVIGMLYIGELARIHETSKRGTLYALFGVLIAVMTAGIVLSYAISRPSFRQLESLEEATTNFARGVLSTRAEVRAKDEIGDLAESFNVMAERIETMHREVVAQREETSVLNRNYLDMLAVVGHELTVAREHSQEQESRLEHCQIADSGAKRAGARLRAALEDLESIIGKYEQLARIEAKELVIDRNALRVGEDIVQPVVHALRSRIEARGMSVESRVANELVVMADENLISVVLDNLVGNAVRYGLADTQVLIEAERKGDEVVISVWNDGEPIPKSKQASLFRKLHRFGVEDVLGRRSAGLGLYISAQIVQQHGGRIWVESAQGKGTRFFVALPA